MGYVQSDWLDTEKFLFLEVLELRDVVREFARAHQVVPQPWSWEG